jgi:monoamine oxidase
MDGRAGALSVTDALTSDVGPVFVVGGGLAGLCAATALHDSGRQVVVLEARDRLGGRIHSVAAFPHCPIDDVIELGASWFWPDLNPGVAALVERLGLKTFQQRGQGDMVIERFTLDPVLRATGIAGGRRAMRVLGGTTKLVEALAARLPDGAIRLGHEVRRVVQTDDGVEVQVLTKDGDLFVKGPAALLALPPRIAGGIEFVPALDRSTLDAWAQAPTWMAQQAKFLAFYEHPSWIEHGLSGAGQSLLGPLMEVHDASMPGGTGALLGFVRATPAERAQMGGNLVKACVDQLARMYGEAAASPLSVRLMDWATEERTAASADLQIPFSIKPRPMERHFLTAWDGRVQLASSEASEKAPGYLEGAVHAVMRYR